VIILAGVMLVVVAAGLAVLFWYLWHTSFRGSGLLWFKYYPRPSLEKQGCERCDGTGVEWLSNGRWQPIPVSLRISDKGRKTLRVLPRQANIRECRSCHGMGHRWGPVSQEPEND
jgi:hypothetical protein